MPPVPRKTTERTDEIPGIAAIMHQLSMSSSSELFVDSIRVYEDRIFLRLGLKFPDPGSWRAAGIDPDVLMAPETFNAIIRYPDGETISASTDDWNKNTGSGASSVSPPKSARILMQASSRGGGLQWYIDYLISPLPTEDIIFSAEFPRLRLERGDWLLSKSAIAECLEIRSQYAGARKAAEENGYSIKTSLNGIAGIAARLAHLGAWVDFGNAKLGWEPTVKVPLKKSEILSIGEITSGDALNVTVRGAAIDSYLLEVSGGRGMQVIALNDDVTIAAKVLIAGLRE